MTYSHPEAAAAFEPTVQYAELRQQCPLHHETGHDPDFYILTRFDDVLSALQHPEQWSNADGPGVFHQEAGVLGSADDPDHARHREVVRPSFAAGAIRRIGPRVREIATTLLDDIAPLQEGDFVELFAAPFPALVIAELLGVRAELREEFRALADRTVHALTGGDMDGYHQAKAGLGDHVERGMADRDAMATADLPDDVFTRLAVARRNGVLTTDEARHLGYQLLVAGHETTTSILGLMLYRLIERPEIMARLRADPTLLPDAVEEAVRFDAPVHGLFRTNTAACTVHGTDLSAGTKVQLVFAAANRDPAAFTDPDAFVIDRPHNELRHHLGFGWGAHHCIGAPLARIETVTAFELLFERMHDIQLAGAPRRNESFVLHGLTHLPIRWSATPSGA